MDKNTVAKPWVQTALGLLIFLAFVLVIGGAVLFWEAAHAFSIPSLWGRSAEVKDLLDAYEKHASVLQAMISALLLVTAFYSAGLAAFSYFNARNALEDARRSASEAEKIKSEIRKTFPIFADLEVSAENVLRHLSQMFPDIDWSRGFYEGLDPQQKQEILFYERAVALFKFLNMQEFRAQISQAYRGLGCFYGTKYQYEGASDEGDYQRALFYLDLGVAAHENIRTLNDRGALAMIPQKTDPDQARRFFDRSHAIDPEHQRALYNLAVIWHREGKSKTGPDSEAAIQRSIDYSTKALGLKRWQEKEVLPYQADLHYNRACQYTRLAERQQARRDELLKNAAADLRAGEFVTAIRNKNAQLIKALKDDLKPAGDLYLLANTPPHSAAVQELLALI